MIGHTIYPSPFFSKNPIGQARHITHELFHVFDNNLGEDTGILINFCMTSVCPTDSGINFKDATWYGGGSADDLIRYLGGNPTGLRFMNGTVDLADSKKWAKGSHFSTYGNHSTADYFAEVGVAAVYSLSAPSTTVDWFNTYLWVLEH